MASDRELLEELVGRARRTETRVTKLSNHIGVDAGEEKPVYHREISTLDVTNRKASLDDILAAVPDLGMNGVDVYCGKDYLLTISKP